MPHTSTHTRQDTKQCDFISCNSYPARQSDCLVVWMHEGRLRCVLTDCLRGEHECNSQTTYHRKFPTCVSRPGKSRHLKLNSATIWPGFRSVPPAVSRARKGMCAFVTVSSCPHTERPVPTRLKKRCPEVGCPFPTSSPFQRLEIPLRTKRPDMIPQHCRRGREPGTVLIWQALLSGKILKGMQPIVVNCMGLHSVPSAAGMCY